MKAKIMGLELDRELKAVADDIGHIKREIGALQVNDLYHSHLPMAHDELGSVVKSTADATDTIMSAAEEILGLAGASLDGSRGEIEGKILKIFEACSFQDLTGQRIGKVVESLARLEKRLARFIAAVAIEDQEGEKDCAEVEGLLRKQELMLNGPQQDGTGVDQNDVDALFD